VQVACQAKSNIASDVRNWVESGRSRRYLSDVAQDPEYLRSRARQLHASYRRSRRLLNFFVACWVVFFTGRFLVAMADWMGKLGWGYTTADIWGSLGFVAFAGFFWLFATAIRSMMLAYIRHTYGPDPTE
jgi:hypothetical protein